MLDPPDTHAHHKTGHSRVDLIIGCLAVLLSSVSIFIALRHGSTMERLVAANSWPNLSYSTSNESEDGRTDLIRFDLRNTGVGPARIDTFELFYAGKPLGSTAELLVACCGEGSYNSSTSAVRNEVLPARDQIEFLAVQRDRNRAATWTALNTKRFAVRIRACYCSVFDECWVRDTAALRPERIERCTPSQPVQFKE